MVFGSYLMYLYSLKITMTFKLKECIFANVIYKLNAFNYESYN